MTWQRLLLCFELQSPLHIGFLPNRPGTVLAPTRGYVPGKAVWGAVTAGLTPRLCKSPTARQFRQVGEEIKRQVFFSYFYLSDGEQIFIPAYTPNGLKWDNYDDRAFRAMFLESYVSTRIDDQAGIAADSSLHEIEFIRDLTGYRGEAVRRVLLIGAVWMICASGVLGHPLTICDGSILCGDINIFEGLTIGGERNYGFGRIDRIEVPKKCRARAEEIWKSAPDQDILLDYEQPLIGHLPYRADCVFFGDIEVLAGREYRTTDTDAPFINPGKHIFSEGAHFVPGTRVCNTGVNRVRMDSWGRLFWQ
ncbi:hypothetical protein [Pelotomaculum propionicicum]|uniref:Uncharacterized protein n=1 Tax=Pelotomaculum propionicicum TaxID=258475 RepID=A0A4Y7RVF5_9FIRM|nr:hypothetical protein [Pelotomaculum propionicicum]TEB12833.1 hypothetical protein Pmgp_00809 [Pelotomaculum propionicicum]